MTQILENKTAIVTGGAKGIGLAISQALAAAGAKVVIADIDGAAADAAASSIAGATGVTCDVRDEAAVQQLVADNSDVSIFVSNAGVARVSPLVSMSLDEWREVLNVDLDGVFLCVKHAGAAMAANGGGSIINIASIKAFGGSPATGHYGAAKAGVVSLTKTAALELRGHGVRVNAICPGWIETDMVNERKGELEAALGIDFGEAIGALQGRLGRPEELGGLAVWLASDRARFASGTAYVVDNALTASLP